MANRSRSGRLDPATRAAQARQLRDEGMTQRAIAERLDVSISTVSNDLHRAKGASSESESSQNKAAPGSSEQLPGWGRLLGPVRAVAGALRRLVP